MDRKWRTNPWAHDTILSFPEFRAQMPTGPEGKYYLASDTDLYATYTVLVIEAKEWELRWSQHAGLYYFLTLQRLRVDQSGATEKATATAPEGDEDPPEVSLHLNTLAAVSQLPSAFDFQSSF
jgi:hypothetical protein